MTVALLAPQCLQRQRKTKDRKRHATCDPRSLRAQDKKLSMRAVGRFSATWLSLSPSPHGGTVTQSSVKKAGRGTQLCEDSLLVTRACSRPRLLCSSLVPLSYLANTEGHPCCSPVSEAGAGHPGGAWSLGQWKQNREQHGPSP